MESLISSSNGQGLLNTPSVRVRLETAINDEDSSSESFDPYFALLMSYVINLKLGLRSYYYGSEGWDDERIRKSTRDVIKISGMVDGSNIRTVKMLQAFRVLSFQWWEALSLSEGGGARLTSSEWDEEFLALAAYHGLWNLVDEMVQSPAQLLQTKIWPAPLRLALGVSPSSHSIQAIIPSELYRLTPAMVEGLLSRGSDPNAHFGQFGQSIWQEFLQHVSEGILPVKKSQVYYIKCFEIIKSMLEHGAEIGLGRRGDSEFWTSLTIDAVIDNVLAVQLPDNAFLLRSMLQQKRSTEKRRLSPQESQPSSKRQAVVEVNS
jgi:hypothetical protein